MIAIGALQEKLGITADDLNIAEEALLLGAGLLLRVKQQESGPLHFMDLPELLEVTRPLLAWQLRGVFNALAHAPLESVVTEVAEALLQNRPPEEQQREAARLYGEALDRIPSDQEHFTISASVAQLIAGTFPIRPGMRILDPACGSGRLLVAMGERLRSSGVEDFSLYGTEPRPLHAALAELNLLLNELSDAVIQREPPPDEYGPDSYFDAVMCVPPRGSLRDPSAFPYAAELLTHFDVLKSRPQSLGLALLADSVGRTRGGRVAFMLPAGILYRMGLEAYLREWLARHYLVLAAVSFPVGLIRKVPAAFALIVLDIPRRSSSSPLIDTVRLVDATTNRTNMAEPFGGWGMGAVLSALERVPTSLPTVDVSLEDQRNNDYSWQVKRYTKPQEQTPNSATKEAVHSHNKEVRETLELVQKSIEETIVEMRFSRAEADAAMTHLKELFKEQ